MLQLRLLSSTALLTLFVWFTADQLVTKTVDVTVQISVRAERGSDLVLATSEDAPSQYTVTLSGRQADIASIREAGVAAVTLTLRSEALRGRELGVLRLSLRDELRTRTSAFAKFTIQKVDPPTMPVKLDRRVQVEVPVQVRSSRLEYAVPPRVEPEAVTVTLLQTVYEAIASAGPRIVLDAEACLKNQPEGQAINLDVPLHSTLETDQATYEAIDVEPDTVNLRATLRLRLARGTIQAVPIKYLISPHVYEEYRAEPREENPDVTVSIDVVGPPDEVDRLVKGDRKIFAVINLGSAGAGGAFQFYQPHFDLPPGVKLVEDQAIPSFEIRLVPRTSPIPVEETNP